MRRVRSVWFSDEEEEEEGEEEEEEEQDINMEKEGAFDLSTAEEKLRDRGGRGLEGGGGGVSRTTV